MDEPHFGRVAILGVGLIGGSLGLALRRRGLADEVVGYSRTPATRALAAELGAIDRVADSAEDCVDGADLVYLATPVAAIVPLLTSLAPRLRSGAVVTDAGSSKARIVAEAAALGCDSFVGGHPMTGSEAMGVAAARADLFDGMTYALTPTSRTSPAALAQVRALAEALGSRVVELSPEDHDRAAAAISHLPHLLATVLMLVTEQRAQEGAPVYELAAGSWTDGTRVAASGATMWREILVSNREAVLEALADFGRGCERLRALLAEQRDDELETLLETARRLKLAHPGRQRP